MFLTACGESGENVTLAPSVPAAEHPTMHREELRRIAGVDQLPTVVDKTAFREKMSAYRSEALGNAKFAKSALVDVSIDAHGRVNSVAVVPRPPELESSPQPRAFLQEPDGSLRPLNSVDDPAVGRAAQSILRDVRFNPAIRDGKAVAYTLRMTVSFSADQTRVK